MEMQELIAEIQEKYSDEIEFYSFCQFVLEVQNEATKKFALKKGIKMIADRQVAFSDRDAWAYQSLFLEGWCLGCPPDYFSKDGQAWGFPVMDPEKMYNADGSLGEGGILMKNLYKKMFKENPGGVRIDHMVGLIDPWVYVSGKKPKIEIYVDGPFYPNKNLPTKSAQVELKTQIFNKLNERSKQSNCEFIKYIKKEN